ncbi:UNVERIFIED_CONTAM: hypothetical protein FKN15_072374 [Acipenser sinensis]
MKRFCPCLGALAGQDWSKSDEKLLQAVELNDPERVAALILKKGLTPAKLDPEGKSAFHASAMRGSVECLEVMLAHGVDVTVTDGAGFNALHLAARHGHPETALMLACESDSVETVEVLLRGGANINIADALGHSAAHYSMATGNEVIMNMLHSAPNHTSRTSAPAGTPPAWDREDRNPPQEKSPPSTQHCSTGTSDSPAPSPERDCPPQAGRGEDEEVFEEIRRLRQERGRLLQKIKSLEQLSQSAQQQASTAAVLEEELHSLRERLEQKERDNEGLCAEMSELRGRVSLSQRTESETETASQTDTETDHQGQDMEELFEFPGAEQLLSTRSRGSEEDLLSTRSRGSEEDLRMEELFEFPAPPHPTPPPPRAEQLLSTRSRGSEEDLLSTLQRQVDTLTQQNRELQEKVQMLETYENDGTEIESQDFIPVLLYDSLKSELDRLQERYSQAQAEAEACRERQEREEAERGRCEARIQRLEAELEESRERVGPGESAGEEPGGKTLEEMAKELRELEAKHRETLDKVEGLQEQVRLGIYSVEENVQAMPSNKDSPSNEDMTSNAEASSNTESLGLELKKARQEAAEAGEALRQRVEAVKELEARVQQLQDSLAHRVSLEEFQEMRLGLSIQLEEISRERAELAEKHNQALLEIERIRGPEEEEEEEQEEEEEEERGERQEGVEEEGDEGFSRLPLFSSSPVPGVEAAPLEAELSQARQALSEAVERLEAERAERAQEERSLRGQQEELRASLSAQREQDQRALQELRAQLGAAQQESARLRAELEVLKQEAVSHEEQLQVKDSELAALRQQKEGSVSQEQLEEQRRSMQVEINTLTAKLSTLTRQHEKTCTEVQREALFMKSEKHSAEAALAAVEKQLQELRSESGRVQELHQRIEESSSLVRERDHKITELSKEVFRLKEALGTLSQPLAPPSRPAPSPASPTPVQLEALRSQVTTLQQQIQGHMDEEVQGLLLQILRMHQQSST